MQASECTVSSAFGLALMSCPHHLPLPCAQGVCGCGVEKRQVTIEMHITSLRHNAYYYVK